MRKQGNASLRLLGTVPLFGIFVAPSALGQSMGSYAVYSDTWFNTSNPNQAINYVVGAGVTQDYNNIYGHNYWTVTTVRSPAGRTATTTSYTSASYARTETSLLWDPFDAGNYTVETKHWIRCPYIPYPYPSSTTTTGIFIGASISVLTKAAMSNTYTKVANCNVTCPVDGFLSSYNRGQYILGIRAVLFYSCSSRIVVYDNVPASSQCEDVGI